MINKSCCIKKLCLHNNCFALTLLTCWSVQQNGKEERESKEAKAFNSYTTREFAELGSESLDSTSFIESQVATSATLTVDGKRTFVTSQKFALMHVPAF
jgi:hypothetical protein